MVVVMIVVMMLINLKLFTWSEDRVEIKKMIMLDLKLNKSLLDYLGLGDYNDDIRYTIIRTSLMILDKNGKKGFNLLGEKGEYQKMDKS